MTFPREAAIIGLNQEHSEDMHVVLPVGERQGSVGVRLNVPFTVQPRRDFTRTIGTDLHKGYPYGSIRGVSIPLIGVGEEQGKVEIREEFRVRAIRENEQLLLPGGEPCYDFYMDPKTGKTVARALPISIGLTFGPFTNDEINSGDVSFSILFYGKEFRAHAVSVPFLQSKRRLLTALDTWEDVDKKVSGPMVFPSGVDFRKIQLVINKNTKS
ncbi:MAG TPA: hypothetical protein VG917_05790 [Patescibacteria group bacterium]|nr:hypothetical protein [Patescibacteria group bacterium]